VFAVPLLATLVLCPQGSSSTHTAPRRLLAPVPACAQGEPAAGLYLGALSLALHPQLLECAASSYGPYGAALAPDGASLYVALFGSGFGAEGCRLARFDTGTLQLTGSVATGLGPVEIAFATPAGSTLGFSANSSGSSVTVFDASDAVLATIPIPPQPASPWGTAFPSGLAVSPDQSRVYVTTNDSSGLVFAIDTTTLMLVPGETLSLGRNRAFSRPLFAGDQLVLPTTRFHTGFSGSTAELILLDPSAPAARRTTVLASSPDSSAFPSPLDAALWCDVELFVAGFDMGRRLFVLDPATGAVVDEIALPTSGAAGSYQGLATGPNGLVALTEYLTNELVWVDALSRTVLAVQPLAQLPDFHSQLNELVLLPSGAALVATGQHSDSLALFALP
jgi:DNA-binding beta-propeller fold protein YncE